MLSENARRRGGQPGNQNARKHGFYSRVLSQSQQRDFKSASRVEGLENEINILRIKLKSLIDSEPDNVRLIALAAIALSKLINTQFRIMKDQNKRKGLQRIYDEACRDFGVSNLMDAFTVVKPPFPGGGNSSPEPDK